MKNLSAIKYLMILFLFTALGCEEIVLDKTFKLDRESTFRLNELSTSSDGQYTLLIKEILDSRCPRGVQCIWEGEVVVKGEFTAYGNKSTFEVHSVVKDQNKQPEGYTIQVIDAQPYPVYGRDNNPESLIVTLLIKKNSKLDTITFAPSMKGWELYSWANGNDWKYSILMGTNRNKTYDEVITNKIAVVGKDSLKMLLDKFPVKEEIFWIGKGSGEGWSNLSFPDQTTIDEIRNYALQKELQLHVMQ